MGQIWPRQFTNCSTIRSFFLQLQINYKLISSQFFCYSKNARRIAKLLAANPNRAEKIFIENLEFAAQFPELATNLQMASANLLFWKLHNFDIFLAAICSIFGTLLMIKFTWKCFWRYWQIGGPKNDTKMGKKRKRKRGRKSKRK
jgi:hypothetical protein